MPQPAAVLLPEALKLAESGPTHPEWIEELSKFFSIPEKQRVADFLDEHPEIPDALLRAVPHLQDIFGRNAVLQLRFSPGDYGGDVLYPTVSWSGESRDVRAALSRFDDWWIPDSGPNAQFLCFTYELV